MDKSFVQANQRIILYIIGFQDKILENMATVSVMIRKRKIQTHLAARHSLAVLLSRSGIENMYKVEV